MTREPGFTVDHLHEIIFRTHEAELSRQER
jgi:hypothetical protein